jgi:hypothetical protein
LIYTKLKDSDVSSAAGLTVFKRGKAPEKRLKRLSGLRADPATEK